MSCSLRKRSEIDRFDQHVTMFAEGRTVAVDDLDVTFSQQRRAIFRGLDGQTEFTSYGGCDFRVDRGDASDPWHLQFEPGTAGPRIRIGDAATYLDPGTYRYRLGYSAPRGTTSWPTIRT